MPTNRNALIRYKTIDQCLRNRFRKWTLNDLIEACSDALYEYEGIDKGVSRRTVQMDIQVMRSEKLGYHAPIEVVDRKYYTYADPDYSITHIPLTHQDLETLTEAVDLLKQFKGFSHFQELSGMVQKLENKIHVSKEEGRSVIDLEKNENLKGLQFIDPIFQTITKKESLTITYQSFKVRKAHVFHFHPALLKEYRNRWFVLGKRKTKAPFIMLALDRIESLEATGKPSLPFDEQVLESYFNDVIGVTVNEGEPPEEVKLFIDRNNAPYVLTKPLHHSQEVLEKAEQGVLIRLFVQLNFELEREILGLGDNAKVVSPHRLRTRIRERLGNAADWYETDLNAKQVQSLEKKLATKGTALLNHVFTQKAVSQIKQQIKNYWESKESAPEQRYAIRHLLLEVPTLKEALLSENVQHIVSGLLPNAQLTKAIFFDKLAQSNWYVTWHQDSTILVREKNETEGFTAWTKKGDFYSVCPPENILQRTVTLRIHLDDTEERNGALKVIPGSHRKKLSDTEIKLIAENSLPVACELQKGGVHFMKPLLLHASGKSVSQKKRKVIHLEFCNASLPNGLEWGEGTPIRKKKPHFGLK